jgi:methylated-DNA-[protein]-cysteine S-methyltransferase
MQHISYTLFPTTIGSCGISWAERGINAVQLPEANDALTLTRLLRGRALAKRQPPTPAIQRTIDDIVALLQGVPCDLHDAVIDMAQVPDFHQRVYTVVRGIPPGQTLSYGEVAARCGDRRAARAVGQALARNPFPLIVPCHRVLAAHGRNGGFSANGGVGTKLRLLAIEGARPLV